MGAVFKTKRKILWLSRYFIQFSLGHNLIRKIIRVVLWGRFEGYKLNRLNRRTLRKVSLGFYFWANVNIITKWFKSPNLFTNPLFCFIYQFIFEKKKFNIHINLKMSMVIKFSTIKISTYSIHTSQHLKIKWQAI